MADVFQEWRNARQHLNDAMQAYSKSIVALGLTFRANVNTWDTNTLDNLALEAQYDSNLIESGFQALGESRAVLNAIRNKSLKRVPASKLPSEVLLEVFRLCTREWPKHYHSPGCSDQHFSLPTLFRLSHVCVAWRKIVVATPSLWSHIDMTGTLQGRSITTLLSCIQTSVERAGDLPLCLDFDFSPNVAFLVVQQLLLSDLFLPELHSLRIQSVYLSNNPTLDSLAAIIARIFQSALPESIRDFVIWQDEDYILRPFIVNNLIEDGQQTSLKSLRVLRLHNLVFDWQSPVYQNNLVHLHLSGIDYPPEETLRIDQLLSVLSSCPGLNILQLPSLAILPAPIPQLQPIVLQQLGVLDLHGMPGYCLSTLLPLLIVPPSNSLSLKLSLSTPSPDAASTLQAFFARVNVTRLYVLASGSSEQETLQLFLTATRNLTTLILDCNSFKSSLYLDSMTQSSVALCPALHSFYLYKALNTSEPLYRFVQAYPSVKRLSVVDSTTDSPYDEVVSQMRSAGLDSVDFYFPSTQFVDHAWYHTMP